MTKKLLLMWLITYFSPIALAEKYHDMSNLGQQIENFIFNLPEMRRDNDTSIKVNAIDRRLKLAHCNQIKFNLASGSHLIGKTSIRVICTEPKAWSFYVTANISRYEQIYIANSTLNRGQIIRESDVYKSRKDLSKLPFGYITKPKDIIGKQVKRHVQAGRILRPSQLINPIVIKRGEIISLQSNSSGFTISMKGTAMSNGAIGDRIRVKNSSSKRIVEGTISQAGIVRIGN